MSLPDHPGLPDEKIPLLDIHFCLLRFARKLEEEGFFKKFSIQ
jgi:hypothetical protein